MPLDLLINQQKVRLKPTDVLGAGGEATVYRWNGEAVKVYFTPDVKRAGKLQALLNAAPQFPPDVIAPRALAFDPKRKLAVGFTMRLLDPSYVEIRKLSVKNYRAQTGLTARDVTQLFVNLRRSLAALHQLGVVVGDLNDLNLLFKGDQALFIDVDSFQFETYACLVGTEQFIDPTLYGTDLALRPTFTPEHDWYSFAVLWFKSLLLAHPYGGTHPKLPTLPMRAQSRVTVFDSAVQYPRIAYPPDLLTDDLLEMFEAWFAQGRRGIFPETTLHEYLGALVDCANCGAAYPASRRACPICAAPVTVPATVPLAGWQSMIETAGEIVAWQVKNGTIYAIAHEHGKAVLYTRGMVGSPRRVVLFNAEPTAVYAFLDDTLIIATQPDSAELLIVDVSGDTPKGLTKTLTDRFGHTAAMFGASGRSLYRLAEGYLMRGRFEHGTLAERPVLAVAQAQTRIDVAPEGERVFGYFRIAGDELPQYQYWLLVDDARSDLPLPPLEAGEALLEANAKFARDTVLIARRTLLAGAERVRLEEVDPSGKLLISVLAQPDDFTPLDAHAYGRGMVLHATDTGIVQKRLDTGVTKTFSGTESAVKRGDALHPFERGLLVISEKRISYVTV